MNPWESPLESRAISILPHHLDSSKVQVWQGCLSCQMWKAYIMLRIPFMLNVESIHYVTAELLTRTCHEIKGLLLNRESNEVKN